MNLKTIREAAQSGTVLTDAQIDYLLACDLQELCDEAFKLKQENTGDMIERCAIINAKSGTCSEDCTFCAQSAHYSTHSPVYPFIDVAQIREAALAMKARGVRRFSIVTSGIAPVGEEIDRMIEGVRAIAEVGLKPDVSVGILDRDTLIRLKAAGLSGYHHNLEVSRSFFPQICTTHDYDDDVNAVKTALELGLFVCCGGIFGLGETWAHRVELAREIQAIGVKSVPINFLTPIPGTPLENRPVLSPEEAYRIVALYRFLLPKAMIRVCGGRQIVFDREGRKRLLSTGVSGIMVGDYLTMKGVQDDDLID